MRRRASARGAMRRVSGQPVWVGGAGVVWCGVLGLRERERVSRARVRE